MIINYQTGMRIIVARSDEHPNIVLLGVASAKDVDVEEDVPFAAMDADEAASLANDLLQFAESARAHAKAKAAGTN